MKPTLIALTAFSTLAALLFIFQPETAAAAQDSRQNTDLDKKVRAFLDRHSGEWHDMNIPAEDGQRLYDRVIKSQYRRALEIGTSTGHSAIWIAWALSKTGGKLTTIEIDEYRYRTALANFAEAGLAAFIDARLADAHELVSRLEGPFDFVFCDADKEWYTNYFKAMLPKLTVGGCFAAHNVSPGGRGPRGIRQFVEYVRSLPNVNTTIEDSGWSGGISFSVKTAEQ